MPEIGLVGVRIARITADGVSHVVVGSAPSFGVARLRSAAVVVGAARGAIAT